MAQLRRVAVGYTVLHGAVCGSMLQYVAACCRVLLQCVVAVRCCSALHLLFRVTKQRLQIAQLRLIATALLTICKTTKGMSKETYISRKETYASQKETCVYLKRDVRVLKRDLQNRPDCVVLPLSSSRSVKRQNICQKRLTFPEKRPVHPEKRPTKEIHRLLTPSCCRCMSDETYISDKEAYTYHKKTYTQQKETNSNPKETHNDQKETSLY